MWKNYYKRLLGELRHSWGVADTLATAMGFVLPISAYLGLPESAVTSLAWQVPVASLLLIGLGRLILAPYLLFKKDNQRWRQAEAELTALHEAQRPQLSGEIRTVVTGGDHFSDKVQAVVILSVIIRNRGEPSIAENWFVTAHFPDGSSVAGELHSFEKLCISHRGSDGKEVQRTIARGDYIFIRAMNPIPKGGAVSGFLAVLFPGRSSDEMCKADPYFTIAFQDIDRQQISCSSAKHGPDERGLSVMPTADY